MPLVNVLINSRAYTLACDEGEEEHLRELAQFLDSRVKQLVESVGQVGDTRLLVMAGLVIADELAEALHRVSDCERQLAALKADESGASSHERLAEILESAAAQIDDIAARVARA